MKRYERAATELDRLEELFRRLDLDYSEKARRYGFNCSGCTQTCCGERFYHHTLAETLLLERGLAALSGAGRTRIFKNAEGYMRAANEGAGDPVCPLYTNGGCGMYRFRPLICRLHGIAYDYTPPGGAPFRGEGCHRFEDEIESAGRAYEPFDRTPYFGEMATIEISIRRMFDDGGRFRRTVAELICGIARNWSAGS